MKQATQKRQPKALPMRQVYTRVREGALICGVALALYLLLALLTYHATDAGWSSTGSGAIRYAANAGGRIGAWLADVFFYFFGYMAYLFPFAVIYSAYLFFTERSESVKTDMPLLGLKIFGFLLLVIASSALASLHFLGAALGMPFSAGGLLGNLIATGLMSVFNYLGTTLILLAFFCSGMTLFTGCSWLKVLDWTGQMVLGCGAQLRTLQRYLAEKYRAYRHQRQQLRAQLQQHERSKEQIPPEKISKKIEPVLVAPNNQKIALKTTAFKAELAEKTLHQPVSPVFAEQIAATVPVPAAKPTASPALVRAAPNKKESIQAVAGLPNLALLDPPSKIQTKRYSHEALEAISRDVEVKLGDFGVDVQVVAVHPGPVVTRFELQLAPGLKVSRITSLAKDLARSLSVMSVRIVEVIPGKTVVGLELPNEDREIVRLSEVFASAQYQQAPSALSLALGKDISGCPVVVDLAKMPHLLVAGTTGSGKSVGLNAMILSLLYKATPDQVRMIMIDPKMLELSIYEGIPHLLAPVVTDMKEAANALRWCVAEMDRRYRLMAAMGVRNLTGYNAKITEAQAKGEPILDPFWQAQNSETAQELATLPFIVVLIDELADMMMVVGKKIEDLIARIAQKARAAGIHLILATQRPSVDVITGLIKANIPTRIAFQVSSRIDSRTILDQQGAEQLLGYGDMLYLPPGSGLPVRVHGAYVADHEVHNVVKDLKLRGEPVYNPEILAVDNETANALSGDSEREGTESDPLYDQAVQIVLTTRRASISNIQRRLKIGYNRAARMIDDMESAGLVSAMETNGNREVLVPCVEEE